MYASIAVGIHVSAGRWVRSPGGMASCALHVCVDWVQELDTDGSGRVEYTEWLAAVIDK